MRPFTLVSYLDANDRSRPGLALGDTMVAWSDLATAHGLPLAEATMPELIAAWPMLEPRLAAVEDGSLATPRDLAQVRPAPPVVGGGLFCSGPNYRCHLNEMTAGQRSDIDKKVAAPFFFSKPAVHSIIGPGAPIVLPAGSHKLDWEAELAVVIGRPARDVPVERAMDHVFGYSILNDLSARDVQLDEMRSGFGPQKAKHFASAMSAVVVSADEVLPHPVHVGQRVQREHPLPVGLFEGDAVQHQARVPVLEQQAHVDAGLAAAGGGGQQVGADPGGRDAGAVERVAQHQAQQFAAAGVFLRHGALGIERGSGN